jgi:hypothetical protein
MVFQKGQSGNPGGKPKAADAILRRLGSLGMRAVARLETLLDSENEQIAKGAADTILAYTLGKPRQQVTAEITHNVGASAAHLMALASKPHPVLDLSANANTLITLDNPASTSKQPIKTRRISEAETIDATPVIDSQTE